MEIRWIVVLIIIAIVVAVAGVRFKVLRKIAMWLLSFAKKLKNVIVGAKNQAIRESVQDVYNRVKSVLNRIKNARYELGLVIEDKKNAIEKWGRFLATAENKKQVSIVDEMKRRIDNDNTILVKLNEQHALLLEKERDFENVVGKFDVNVALAEVDFSVLSRDIDQVLGSISEIEEYKKANAL